MREVQGREAALLARVAETAASAGRFRQTLPEVPDDPGEGRHDHLGDPVAAADDKILFPKIGEDHFHLAPVVSINRTGGIQHADLVPDREAAAWPHLRFVADGQGDSESRRDESRLPRLQNNLLLDGSTDIHAGSMFGSVRRERDILGRAIDPRDPDLD